MVRRTKAAAEQTRADLLDAAEHLFHERGVSRTSLDDIAKAAGVTRGAVYWHFRNKLDVLCALQERICTPAEDLLAMAADGRHPDPLGAIEQSTLDTLRELAGDSRKVRVMSILMQRCEYVDEMSEALRRLEESNRELWSHLLEAFRRARDGGRLSPAWTPEAAVWMLRSFMMGQLYEWLKQPEAYDICRIGTGCLDRLFASFRGEATPPPRAAGPRTCDGPPEIAADSVPLFADLDTDPTVCPTLRRATACTGRHAVPIAAETSEVVDGSATKPPAPKRGRSSSSGRRTPARGPSPAETKIK
ncbi:TetR family transcriptional regulator [Segnochrobactrum spirostomi]|uniref:TetR family transcriptional regulator n=1 Tax=Segnochrobactrum spirostomi TaxID=2608987 RepID=A0A6A7XZN4_9HYPH|nr:TetR family transcriptional regulator [Segnochrobactrum spirostomi]MQT11748.1 TetR family transcriptional regulator [Segnochrobactrum spirostomi]